MPTNPARKLGRRPPSNAPALMVKLTGTVPAHPAAADHFAKVKDWGLWGNDQYGDCGPVSVGNLVKLVSLYLTGREVSVTQDDVFDLYRRSGNPHFDPATDADDNGVVMQDMLDALLKGGIGTYKPLAFGKLTVNTVDELMAAVAIFGGVLLGVTLDEAQDAQTDQGLWDYKLSPLWGGHAVLCGRYQDAPTNTADRTAVVTWAEVVDMTDAFVRQQVDEVWVVIWPEHLKDDAFLQGVDVQQLAADFHALTGKTLPLPTPDPGPDPDPVPDPPAPAPDDDAVMAFLRALYAWLRDWFARL